MEAKREIHSGYLVERVQMKSALSIWLSTVNGRMLKIDRRHSIKAQFSSQMSVICLVECYWEFIT